MLGEADTILNDESFNLDTSVKRLVQFIREEKPYFENRVRLSDLIYPQPIIARKNNARILAQSGAFLLFGLEQKIDAKRMQAFTTLIDIPAESKESILDALDAVGINEYSAFPEPEKVSATIKRRYS